MTGLILLLLLPGIFFYLWLPAHMANNRGRSALGWIFLTFVTTPVTTTILLSCDGNLFGERGNGVSVVKEIQVGDFDMISIPSFVDVRYTQTAGEQSVTLTCDENLAGHYVIEVKDGVLVVETRNVILNAKTDTYVTVSSPILRGVKLSGSGDLDIDGPVVTEGDFTVSISGSGGADITGMTASSVSISLTGSGDADIDELYASAAEFKTSGSGDIEADAVTAESISVKTTGSGDCTIGCKNSGTLSIQISGSGDVTLRGTARALVNISDTGSGDFDMSGLTLSGK